MFRAAYRSSSGAPNCICFLWFICPCGDRPLSRLGGNWVPWTTAGHHMGIYTRGCKYSLELWWWAVCRSKHAKPSINFGIIISITRLHLVGYFYWNQTVHMGTKNNSHQTPCPLLLSSVCVCVYIYTFIRIQPLGWFSRNQNPVRRPVWLWHTASWASS